MVNQWPDRLFNALFPATCILCGADGHADADICTPCLDDLPRNTPCCPRCALPLAETALCGACLKQPPHFDRCTAPLRYEGPVPGLITGLKFHQQLANARLLAGLFLSHLQTQPDPLPELIIPVPLHPRRLKTRGYNQALELGKYLQRRLAIPLSLRHCARVRFTTAQADLPRKQRQQNLRNAFRLQQPLPGKRLALLDDVVTTGNTANELARTLKKAGAEWVEVWSMARTP
jgi:ComF family protein